MAASAKLVEIRRDFPDWLDACRESLVALAHSRSFLAVLGAVALVDGILLGLGLATVYADAEAIPFPAWFYLNAEFSFGEIWEYFLTAAAAAGLLWRYVRHREPIIGCLGLVFVWLTLDNSLALHEAIGHIASPLFAFAEHSHPNSNDYGELLAFACISGIILVELFLTALRSDRRSVIQSLTIIAMLGAAAVFGIFVDFLDHVVAGETQLIKSIMSLVEDGGEMVLLSIGAAIAVTARLPERASRA